MALEDQSAMEGYLETLMQGTTLKQKAYGTLVSSEMHTETIEQLVSLPWRAMVTAINVEVVPGVLQTEQKHKGRWRESIEAEMNIRHSETYRRPSGARYLVGSTLAPAVRADTQCVP